MDELTIPADGCSRFTPILFDHADAYCILAAKYALPPPPFFPASQNTNKNPVTSHARMEHCCQQVSGTKPSTLQGCYPWCSIIPGGAAGASSSNDTSPPTASDAIDKFYQCLIDGDDGALPEGMSCSTKTLRRHESSGSRTAAAGTSGLQGKMVASLGAVMMVALLYG